MRSGCLSQHGTPADGALLAHAAAAARQRNGAPVGVLTDHVAAVRVILQPLRSALNTSAGRQTRAASAPGRTVQARLTRSAVLKGGSAILNSSSQAHMLHGEPVMGSLQCLGQTLLLAQDEYYLAPAPPISWHKVAILAHLLQTPDAGPHALAVLPHELVISRVRALLSRSRDMSAQAKTQRGCEFTTQPKICYRHYAETTT